MGQFPPSDSPPVHGDKLNQVFQAMRANLENILEGLETS